MKATKTESGKWTVVASYNDADGKRHRKRFTGERKKDVERDATRYLEEISTSSAYDGSMSLIRALEGYVENRASVLSPSTVVSYRGMAARCIPKDLGRMEISKIRSEHIQILINQYSATHSPKSVRNLYGLLTATFKTFRPDFVLRVHLPQKRDPDLYTPTDDEVKKLVEVVTDTPLEIPVLLSAFGSLRRSEICALTAADIHDGWVSIDKAIVLGPDKVWTLKQPKTQAGKRVTYLPKSVTNRVKKLSKGKKGRIVEVDPDWISRELPKYLERADLPHFRFHALRSYYASALHALSVPDKYIQEWGGWSDVETLRKHYEKTQADKVPVLAAVGTEFFDKLLSD